MKTYFEYRRTFADRNRMPRHRRDRCGREHNNGDKSDKHDPQIQTDDKAVLDAAADLVASGEVTGKMLETALLHKPQG